MGEKHDRLVEIGRKWLLKKSTGRMASSLVLTDMTSSESETPDGIGWNSSYSTLVECKISVSDFKADDRKYFRRYQEFGVGKYRYYMTPKGLISADKIPEKWGLVEVCEKGKTRVVKKALPFEEYNLRAENSMLLSLVRRLKVDPGNHVAIKAYTVDHTYQPRATVSFNNEEAPEGESNEN